MICLIVRRRRWVQNVLRSRKPLSKLRMHKPIMQKVAASMIMQMTLFASGKTVSVDMLRGRLERNANWRARPTHAKMVKVALTAE